MTTTNEVHQTYHILREGLSKLKPNVISNSVLKVESKLLSMHDNEAWRDLLTDAVNVSLQAQAIEPTLKIMNVRGKFHFTKEEDREAYAIFYEMLCLAQENQQDYYKLQAYLGMLRLRSAFAYFSPTVIEDFSQDVPQLTPEQRLRIRNALVTLNLYQGNYNACINAGSLAYSLWKKNGSLTEMAKIAQLMSQAYSVLGNFEDAAYWHQQAQGHIIHHLDTPKVNALLAFNWGFLELFRGHYGESRTFLTTAVDEYARIKDNHGEMLSRHRLAMAMVYEDTQFYDALELLKQTETYWQTQDNPVHLAHTCYTLALAHYKLGGEEVALSYAQEGMTLIRSLDYGVCAFVHHLFTALDDLLFMVKQGMSPEHLRPTF